MKIACFYPANTYAAWSCTVGIADELERMKHEVLRVPITDSPVRFPTVDKLKNLDGILLLGHEHYWKLLDGAYSLARWKKLEVPKWAWYHESAFREDYNPITAETLEWADEHFFPAAQDAEFFDQEHFAPRRSHWLPFGVDTTIFKRTSATPIDVYVTYGCAFIGLIYPKRASFLHNLARHLSDVELLVGNVEIRDLRGTLLRNQTLLYAENIREIRVFVNLPALSQHLVTKVFEVLACGTFLLTPALDGAAAKNMKLFCSKEHLLYYPETHLGYLAQLMRDYLSDEKAAEREKIAAAGCEEVHQHHSLRRRLDDLLSTVGAVRPKVMVTGA